MAEAVTAPVAVPERDDLSFFMEGRHTDVEFLVENGSDSPKSFRAHKTVLAMRNEVFEAMFYGSLAEGDQVRITDLHPDGFSTFLKYLYRQGAIFVDVQQALRARTAAHKYMDSKLVEACDTFIRKSMQPTDVCDVLEYATKHGSLENFDTVIDRLLQENAAQVLESKSFVAASRETVLKVLKNPRLRIKEYDVVKSVYAWVTANCESKIGKPSTTVLQWTMRPFLPELRLLTLTSLEFVEGPSSWNILTESETLAVLSNIIKRGSMKLPLGICTRMDHRMHLPSKYVAIPKRQITPEKGLVVTEKPVAAPVVTPERDDLSFFTEGRHTDVEFLVEDGSESPQRFKAHKMVLAMRSVVFEAMFYGNSPMSAQGDGLPRNDQVHIIDLHPDGFSTFLKYLYSHRAIFVDIKQALRTRAAAEKYLESKLVEACDTFIRQSMQPSNVCDALEYEMGHGNLAGFDDLINRYLETNAVQVLESNSFVAASKETVLRILKNPRLRIKEYDIIKSVYAWAIAHCGRGTGEPFATSALQRTMRPFLTELRFLTLTPLDFVEGPCSWHILSESETLAVLSNIVKFGSRQLPEGICTITVDRTSGSVPLPAKTEKFSFK